MPIYKKDEYEELGLNVDIAPLKIPSLSERRQNLQKELAQVVTEICLTDIEREVVNVIEEYKLKIEVEDMSWEFYPESDDEGGAYYFVEGLNISIADGQDADEVTLITEWGIEASLTEYIREILNEYSDDLYQYDVSSIVFRGDADMY